MSVYNYINYPELLKRAEEGNFPPICLIFGDPFLGGCLFRDLIARLVPPERESFQLERINGEQEPFTSILERLRTLPLFPGRKVVAVKNPISLFSPVPDQKLLHKAEEAWKKVDEERALTLLYHALIEAGISISESESEKNSLLDRIQERWFTNREDTFPEWLKEALPRLLDVSQGDSLSPSPSSPKSLLAEVLKKGFPPGHILLLWWEGPVSNKGVVKTVERYGAVADLTGPSKKKGEQTAILKRILKARLEGEGKSIHSQAEALLLERVGAQTALLHGELEKLIAYVGDRRNILPEDVETAVGAAREEPLYELTAVLGEKKLGEALNKLANLEDQGYNPLQILSGIANALRRLVAARGVLDTLPSYPLRTYHDYGTFSAKILPRLQEHPLPESLTRSHPYVLFQTIKTARSFSLSFLLRSLKRLLETDHLIKTGAGDPSLLIKDFLIFFCRRSEADAKTTVG